MNAQIPSCWSAGDISDTGLRLGEFALVTRAMMTAMAAGGSTCRSVRPARRRTWRHGRLPSAAGWPLWTAIPTALALGALGGRVKGVLIGFLRRQAFPTNLMALIGVRAAMDLPPPRYAMATAGRFLDDAIRFFIGIGDVFGLPVRFLFMAVIAILIHITVARLRIGWRGLAGAGAAPPAAWGSRSARWRA